MNLINAMIIPAWRRHFFNDRHRSSMLTSDRKRNNARESSHFLELHRTEMIRRMRNTHWHCGTPLRTFLFDRLDFANSVRIYFQNMNAERLNSFVTRTILRSARLLAVTTVDTFCSQTICQWSFNVLLWWGLAAIDSRESCKSYAERTTYNGSNQLTDASGIRIVIIRIRRIDGRQSNTRMFI